MSWLRVNDDGVTLTLYIQPGAKKTEVVGLHGEALKIRLHAPPVDGQANAQLIAFLAQRLALPKRAVTLLAGESSRAKRVRVAGIDAACVRAQLGEPAW
ncbi:hypothetical protein PG1C_13230 [Rugosibacter aromaticivorans]|uniref:UPF0235 protein PG1C_13230 n=1 Tax=Rugosibacter aromaticivorans TaxID=1565605 RepID=A0A0C5JBC5_9PROT|nr:DUF167 family protein [Rugosibacter aromaticivorans]AJP49135.1 hypothetical protein PG1C_13230 [Rugosibacter aromaticivorans]TBR12760.1 MAG: YggU family protein [Rugosibacter sp.]